MKQMSLFSSDNSSREVEKSLWQLFVDGASRNNPGPAGIGIYLKKNNEDALERAYFLGKKTNNEAEYIALLLGVIIAHEHMSEHDSLQIFSDSELIVKQIKGIYRVKKAELKVLHNVLKAELEKKPYKIRHVLRAQNSKADALANKGVDEKIPVPLRLQRKIP